MLIHLKGYQIVEMRADCWCVTISNPTQNVQTNTMQPQIGMLCCHVTALAGLWWDFGGASGAWSGFVAR